MRYEDIATSPEQAVEQIYRWSGLGLVPSSVSEWIEKNTKIPACDSDAHRTRQLRANADGNPFGYVYTTPEYPLAGRDGVKSFLRADQRALGMAERRTSERGVVSKTRVPAGKSDGSYTGRNVSECLDNANEAATHAQGTQRESAAMPSMWRTIMPREDAQAVWDACQDSGIMDALGYDP